MKYQVKDPQGQMHIIEGPEGATPDQVIAQAQKLIPQKESLGKAVKSSVIDMFKKPAMAAKDLGTNPQTMANAMPAALGTAGAVAFPFGGGTAGTAMGQGLRYGADKLLGKPVPGLGQHALELVGAALGDLGSGLIQKAAYGKGIGSAETKAGLGAVEKEAPPASIRTAVKFVNNIKGKELTPLEAKQIKPAIDTIFQKGWLRGTQYEPDLVEVSQKVQSTLNQIEGRGVAASGLARTMKIPNAVGRGWGAIPKSVKYGLGVGSGATAPVGIYEIMKKLLGG